MDGSQHFSSGRYHGHHQQQTDSSAHSTFVMINTRNHLEWSVEQLLPNMFNKIAMFACVATYVCMFVWPCLCRCSDGKFHDFFENSSETFVESFIKISRFFVPLLDVLQHGVPFIAVCYLYYEFHSNLVDDIHNRLMLDV